MPPSSQGLPAVGQMDPEQGTTGVTEKCPEWKSVHDSPKAMAPLEPSVVEGDRVARTSV